VLWGCGGMTWLQSSLGKCRQCGVHRWLLLAACVLFLALYWRVTWDVQYGWRLAWNLADRAMSELDVNPDGEVQLDLWSVVQEKPSTAQVNAQEVTFRSHSLKCSVSQASRAGRHTLTITVGDPPMFSKTVTRDPADGTVSLPLTRVMRSSLRASLAQR